MAESPRRTAWLPSVRVYEWEAELVEAAREREQVKMAEFIRRVLVDTAKRRLARAER